ncbi:hypothetical protein CYMTET_27141, partial [Cymbomonas tetramitiformis]
MSDLPWTDAKTIEECRTLYARGQLPGNPEEACGTHFQLAWALAHSSAKKDNKEAVALLNQAASVDFQDKADFRAHFYTLS